MAVDVIGVVDCFLFVVLVCVDELAVVGVISGKVGVDIFLAVSKPRLGEL